jgi:hypothetical protein
LEAGSGPGGEDKKEILGMLRILILAVEYFLAYFVVVFVASAVWLLGSLWRQKRVDGTAYSLQSQASTGARPAL